MLSGHKNWKENANLITKTKNQITVFKQQQQKHSFTVNLMN